MKCFVYKYLYKIIPAIRWQAFLMERHFSRCPLCSKEFAGVTQIKCIGVTPEELESSMDLWPSIDDRITHMENTKITLHSVKPEPPPKMGVWNWAMAAGAVAVLIFFLIPLAMRYVPSNQYNFGQEKKIIINSVTVENQPAKILYFQTKNKNSLIIWVKKNVKEI